MPMLFRPCAHLMMPLILLLALPAYGIKPPASAATPAPESLPAGDAEAPPPMRLPPERAETRRAKQLEEQLKQVDSATEITWLGEGDERFLGLYRPDTSGAPFANLLILHDNLQHPDWPGVVRNLRDELSSHGWNTLSISMPDYQPVPDLPPLPEPEPAADTAAPADPAKNTASKDKAAKPAPAAKPAAPDKKPPADTAAPDPTTDSQPAEAPPQNIEYPAEKVPDVVDARIRLGISFMKEKDPAPLVIVAVGLSAGFAAKKAQTLLIKDVAGLVLIDPVQPTGSDFNTDLDALDLRIPILDIAPQFNPRTQPDLRLANAKKARHEQYQQRIVRGASQNFTGYEMQIVKTVRGWGERLFKP